MVRKCQAGRVLRCHRRSTPEPSPGTGGLVSPSVRYQAGIPCQPPVLLPTNNDSPRSTASLHADRPDLSVTCHTNPLQPVDIRRGATRLSRCFQATVRPQRLRYSQVQPTARVSRFGRNRGKFDLTFPEFQQGFTLPTSADIWPWLRPPDDLGLQKKFGFPENRISPEISIVSKSPNCHQSRDKNSRNPQKLSLTFGSSVSRAPMPTCVWA